MSFSGMVKEELSRHIGTGRHCKIDMKQTVTRLTIVSIE